MTTIITIDKDEAAEGLFCEGCGDRFNGDENAYLLEDESPTGQHVVCAHCHKD